jgi:hypothetical protein
MADEEADACGEGEEDAAASVDGVESPSRRSHAWPCIAASATLVTKMERVQIKADECIAVAPDRALC